MSTLDQPFATEMQWMTLIERGFPVGVLDRLAAAVAPLDAGFKYRFVPKASYARRKLKRRLTAPESAVVTRAASVWAQAVRIWKSEEAAREFLSRPHALLDGRKPIDLVLENEIGAGMVHGVLGRLENGSAV
jgi:putative toxin-antitoxin system antitoxin component (TIGR02293 family)